MSLLFYYGGKMSPLGNGADITIKFSDIHEVGGVLLDTLGEFPSELVISALALTLGRCCSHKVMSEEEQVKFIEDCIDYCAAYFAEGGQQ